MVGTYTGHLPIFILSINYCLDTTLEVGWGSILKLFYIPYYAVVIFLTKKLNIHIKCPLFNIHIRCPLLNIFIACSLL